MLDAYLFFDVYQVKQLTEEWMIEYNERRPHEALNNLTPEEKQIAKAIVEIDFLSASILSLLVVNFLILE